MRYGRKLPDSLRAFKFNYEPVPHERRWRRHKPDRGDWLDVARDRLSVWLVTALSKVIRRKT